MSGARLAAILFALAACGAPAPARQTDAAVVVRCRDELGTVLRASRPPAWLPTEEEQGPCDLDAAGRLPDAGSAAEVEAGRSAEGAFEVAHAGPDGSGRMWRAAVSFTSGGATRGFCFLTSTVGWRHVGRDRGLAARMVALIGRWSRDLDGDGRDELVVPSSVALGPDASLADHAMTATVFVRRGNRFVRDGARTRALRGEMASAYRDRARSTSDPAAPADRDHFHRAAAALERSCSAAGGPLE